MEKNSKKDNKPKKEEVDPNGNVQILGGPIFDEKVYNDENWFVKFYAPWCGHCKKLAPTIDKLATQYANTADIEVVKVDCSKQELEGLCENEEVSTFLNTINKI